MTKEEMCKKCQEKFKDTFDKEKCKTCEGLVFVESIDKGLDKLQQIKDNADFIPQIVLNSKFENLLRKEDK